MLERPGNLSAQASAHIAILGAAVSMLMIAAGAAWPQTPSPAPSLGIQEPAQNTVPQPAPSPSPPEPEGNPGLFNEIGRMFDKLPTLKATQETIEDLNARAKGAARDASESLSHLAKPSSMVSGRMMCPVSTNGAPDCKLGADNLCQAKGYKEGKSLNTDSAETCSARVLIPGRTRKSGDCRTDNFVTSALCQ